MVGGGCMSNSSVARIQPNFSLSEIDFVLKTSCRGDDLVNSVTRGFIVFWLF
jgi:hypothetical protein